jgi:formylmethanofuran:tetrahydromethanopterin formyltransferase
MSIDRARHQLEQALPEGWALDDLKPVFGVEWEVELMEATHDRDVRVSVSAASFGAALDAARACATLGTLVGELPSQASVEIYVAARPGD